MTFSFTRPLEICFSVHETGLTSDAITEVTGQVKDTIERLQSDIPGIKVSNFVHGDYGERNLYYVLKHTDLTMKAINFKKYVNMISWEPRTDGSEDAEERCCEILLREVRRLKWTQGTRRMMVVIGDGNNGEYYQPHNYHEDNEGEDGWREYAQILADMVSIIIRKFLFS